MLLQINTIEYKGKSKEDGVEVYDVAVAVRMNKSELLDVINGSEEGVFEVNSLEAETTEEAEPVVEEPKTPIAPKPPTKRGFGRIGKPSK